MPAVFTCLDCNSEVYSAGRRDAPDNGLCVVCDWVSEIPDPVKRAAMRERLTSGPQPEGESGVSLALD